MDSNHDTQRQRLMYYHYTIPEYALNLVLTERVGFSPQGNHVRQAKHIYIIYPCHCYCKVL